MSIDETEKNPPEGIGEETGKKEEGKDSSESLSTLSGGCGQGLVGVAAGTVVRAGLAAVAIVIGTVELILPTIGI